MIHVEINDLYKKKYILLWSVLSFKAGLLNAAGFLLVGSYISHVTGFGTQVGIALGHSNITFGMELLVIPFSFILGAFFTSLVLDGKYSKQKIPFYPVVQCLITTLLGMVSLGFSYEFFEVNNASIPLRQSSASEKSLILIGILCFICGLKNALTTWASHGRIRTTHLTGLSTDIGLHLTKIFAPKSASFRYPEAKKVSYARISTLLSFSIGSCLSAILIQSIGFLIFYIAFAISIVLSIISLVHRYHRTKSLV